MGLMLDRLGGSRASIVEYFVVGREISIQWKGGKGEGEKGSECHGFLMTFVTDDVFRAGL
jgi:hypothetical protein